MSEEDLDRVHELKESISKKVRELVKRELKGEKPEVEDLVRTQLTEQFRFWK